MTGHRRDPHRRRPGTERRARHDAGGARSPARPPGDGRWPATTPPSSRRRRTDWPSSASTAIAYDVAILTNLTHEHLELHGTWEAYRDAKLRLFEKLARGDRASAGAVDRQAASLAGDRHRQRRRPDRRRVHRRRPGGRRPGPDLRHRPGGRRPRDPHRGGSPPPAHRLRRAVGCRDASTSSSPGGSTSTTRWRSSPWARRSGSTRPPSATASPAWRVVPGRMERIELGQPFGVIVDFAHSPASLQTVLDLLAPLAGVAAVAA